MPLTPTSRLFFRPATLQAFACGCADKSQPAVQFGASNHLPLMHYLSGKAGVGSLLETRSPFAILWAIISIIINPLNAESVWATSHVSNKLLEGVSPPVTHANPAPPVILVISGGGIFASLNDAAPYSVKRVCGGIDSINGLGHSFANNLPIATTAGGCVALPQITKPGRDFFPAIADANHRSRFFWPDSLPFSNHSESSESGSFFNVELNRHDGIIYKTKAMSTII